MVLVGHAHERGELCKLYALPSDDGESGDARGDEFTVQEYERGGSGQWEIRGPLGIERGKQVDRLEGKVRTCEAHRGHEADNEGRLEGLICGRPGSFPWFRSWRAERLQIDLGR